MTWWEAVALFYVGGFAWLVLVLVRTGRRPKTDLERWADEHGDLDERDPLGPHP